ncbi:ABC transporter ATP-binding protein [Streptomyces sp. NBC_01077]|uniref:ABC transporter ATP-binding protein n=1 Tax=Streptomyces sp. NBC_01077 TaxID=2903746 RepID=UPI003869F49E|nr:ABC transporter ATP-binding protein [Streptomyces sp. NBC_01077]WSV43573.1 ABC transporter ATP-binding protein [Streptomyces sp. NBC_01077]
MFDQPAGSQADGLRVTGPRVAIRDVSRTFLSSGREVKALGPVSLDIDDGAFICVVGPSGCGKSTLLRILAGLIRPTSGSVEIRKEGAGTLLSMVFQDHNAFPWKTVRQNIRFGLDIMSPRPSKSDRNQRVDELLRRLGIADFADAYPATLSGGMRQRVAIGQALAVDPEVLLMDEPFASLDAQLRLNMQLELVRLWENDRRTVIFVTHSLDEAIFLGDRVIVLGPRPGVVCDAIEIPFPRPRHFSIRSHQEFGAIEAQIWRTLQEAGGTLVPPLPADG